jgi:hypothetical protein
VAVSVDSLNGVGYFFLNNEIVKTFNFQLAHFYQKNILYGDFFVLGGDEKINALYYSGKYINTVSIGDIFIPSDTAFIIPMVSGKSKIETIHITIPCGTRNNNDNIDSLQKICGASSFKSNNINIKVKNLNVSRQIQQDLAKEITSKIDSFTPININVNSIDFENYKL